MRETSRPVNFDRRSLLQTISGLGIGTLVFQRALAAQVEQPNRITADMIQQAEWVAGIELSEEEREVAARSLQGLMRKMETLRKIPLSNDIPPAVAFRLEPPSSPEVVRTQGARPIENHAGGKPAAEDLAFLPVTELAALLQHRKISSVELTKLYLERLHAFDKQLHCVVTFTDDLALRQAERADRELAQGRYRGPLHGVPWGAKDLIAYPGFPTTWGAPQFQEQVLSEKATVARRLDDAGAVLVAKLTLGAIAMGDQWFGGMTRNPWNTEQGSSGSSAGSAAATAAGCVGFSLGSETLGSIISPSRRCGTTGLRPTFGRVSRYGCMTLAWSMDKIGPICRSVEDCALVLDVIRGADGHDTSAVDADFAWPSATDIRGLRVGYFADKMSEVEQRAVDHFRQLGCELVPIQLPRIPAWAMTFILDAESACAFDDLVRDNNLEGLNHWPRIWQKAEFVTAVEYLRANRVRTLLQREMDQLFGQVDVYLGGDDLAITNLTGHPSLVMPGAEVTPEQKAQPASLKITGKLFDEETLLLVAHAYQTATDYHLQRPVLAADEGE